MTQLFETEGDPVVVTTVMVENRVNPPFAVPETEIEPFPTPLEGLKVVKAALSETAHSVFDVTVIVKLKAAEVWLFEAGETDKVLFAAL